MADFKKLVVWRKAHDLALEVHRVAAGIRERSHASLRSQMTRAADSMPANIVEGRAHPSEREFRRYLRIAVSSASELEYHLIKARDIGAIRQRDFLSLMNRLIEVRKMLYGLIRRIDLRTGEGAELARTRQLPP